MGRGAQVDELILSMNRATERAAPTAKSIFWDAIAAIGFDDAKAMHDVGAQALPFALDGLEDVFGR